MSVPGAFGSLLEPSETVVVGFHGVKPESPVGIPDCMWIDSYMDWLRDLGLLGKPGEEIKAAREVAEYSKKASSGQ